VAQPQDRDLELLAVDAFSVFGSSPKDWPDIVQINRSGVSDANIRGTWSFQDRVEFYNFPLASVEEDVPEEIPINPDSSGSSA
jgi:hypothetical protein